MKPHQLTIPAVAVATAHKPGPLFDVNTTRSMLGLHRDQVGKLVQSGDLRWAFDVGTGATEAAIRVWSECVYARRDGRLQPPGPLEAVINEMFPGIFKRFRAVDLEIKLSIARHVFNKHIESKALFGELKGNVLWIPRESLVNFLHARRLN